MTRLATLVAAIALILPSAALAQGSSSCQAYNSQTCSSISTTTTAASSSPATSSTLASTATEPTTGQTLPFTGIDVVLLAVGGGVLLAGGLVVRRLSRRLS